MATKTEAAQLVSRMETEDLRKLQNLFMEPCGTSRFLSRAEFSRLASSSVGRGSGEEFSFLFDSVGERSTDPRSGEALISWSSLVSFLLVELSEKVRRSRSGRVPRWKPPRTLTCPHRDPVQKVLHLSSWAQYLTVSRGGTASLRHEDDLSLLHVQRLQHAAVAPKDLWVTDVVLLPNANQIAVSFTSKEVCFYDTLSKKGLSCKYKLQGLKFTPWCLDYWVDPSDPDRAVLTIGDTGGQVSAIHFTSASISLFERLSLRTDSDSDSADVVLWEDLVRGKHRCCYTLTHQGHAPAWVRKVRYLGAQGAMASCSTRPQSSLVIGWREGGGARLRVASCLTRSGVWDMDHHSGLNLIATAGVDHRVLLWNPCVTSEPVCALGRHMSPVVAVGFMQAEQPQQQQPQLVSFSKDQVLCVWDVCDQLCVQRLTGIFPPTPEDAHTSLFLHEERHRHRRLLFSFNSLLLLLESQEQGEEEEKEEKEPLGRSPATSTL